MLGNYAYVEGASLTRLILDVRAAFFARLPYELDDLRRPQTVLNIAIELFDGLPIPERLGVLSDLDTANDGLIIIRPASEVFEASDAPPAFLTDLVAEVVQQVLLRDRTIQTENAQRQALADESAAELEQQWRFDEE